MEAASESGTVYDGSVQQAYQTLADWLLSKGLDLPAAVVAVLNGTAEGPDDGNFGGVVLVPATGTAPPIMLHELTEAEGKALSAALALYCDQYVGNLLASAGHQDEPAI